MSPPAPLPAGVAPPQRLDRRPKRRPRRSRQRLPQRIPQRRPQRRGTGRQGGVPADAGVGHVNYKTSPFHFVFLFFSSVWRCPQVWSLYVQE